MRVEPPKSWSPSIIAALATAVVLLAAGVWMAFYQERLYSEQQIKSLREQAQILAANAAVAIVFDDRAATGQVKVQFSQISERGRKVAVFTFEGTDGLGELVAELSQVQTGLALVP